MKISLTRVALCLTLGALLLAACGGGSAGTPTPSGPIGDASVGQEKYAGTCASCHGPDAKGITGLGKDLTTSEFVKGQSDADLVAFVTQGRDASDPANTTGVAMPPKGGNPALTEQDIYDIVAYVRTLQE